MNDMTPHAPARPLIWPDALLDLAEHLFDYPQPIHIVGGAVRDAYYGLPLRDCDLITPVGATGLARKIANLLNGDVYVMDAERDVARVMVDADLGHLSLDVASYRGPDLLTDLIERDFTLNAMAVDLRDMTMLIDPLNGEGDLKQKLIRRCTDHSISHDPIRALRAVRQSIQLNAHIEKLTMLDIRANASRLYDTSPERVRDEFVKILATERPHAALRVMVSLGLLKPILPDLASLPEDRVNDAIRVVEQVKRIFGVISQRRTDNTASAFNLGAIVVALDQFRSRLQNHIAFTWPMDRPHSAILNLLALLLTVTESGVAQKPAEYVEEIAGHLRLSNAEKARSMAVLHADFSIVTSNDQLDVLAQHRFWHRHGVAGVDVIILGLARYLAQAGVRLEHKPWVRILERARTLLEAYYSRHSEIVSPPPVIDGTRLMHELHLKSGPIIRELLDEIREGQVTGKVNDDLTALALAQAYLSRQ